MEAAAQQRDMIWFGKSDGVEGLLDRIQAAGWQPYFTHAIDEARNLINQHRMNVGVAVLEDGSAASHVDTGTNELLSSTESINWIGLLKPESVEAPDRRQIISHYCYDYHTYPLDLDRLLVILGHAHGMGDLSHSLLEDGSFVDEEELVGTSSVMYELYSQIRKVALVDAPLLITGESGTGKELSALAIHERSRRNTGPFIAVNCAALPSTLIQSELFGYEKGSFTGAQQRKKGRIESAEGGTLFLDEIGDLPLDLQVNLLRFLQQSTIQRVGGKEEIPVDARIIAATHIDLEQAVKEGRFREDLYYRLNVLQMKIPSLCDRDGDIEVLANYFFKRFSNEKNPRVKGFRKDTIRTMNSYSWPGNVRELINRVRRAMVMCDGSLITPRDFGLERRSSRRVLQTLAQARYKAERSAILAALRAEGNNISRAAKLLGTSRVTLHRLLTKYELNN